MSYDLVFWRQEGVPAPLPKEVYKALLDEERVEGLADLDVGGFLAMILESFPGAIREPNGNGEWIVWAPPDQKSMFEVWWSPQHVLVCCRGTTKDVMNRLIDIALDHGCRLYDPQVNERFDSE